MERWNEFSVWCGTYHKYNCGRLKGEWLNLDDYESAEEFWEACKKLHSDESDPEFMFNDCEQPCDFFDGEPSYSEINKWYEFRDAINDDSDYSYNDFEVAVDFIRNVSGYKIYKCDAEEYIERAKDRYVCEFGEWDDRCDEMADEYISQFKGFDSCYFDYDSYKRGLEESVYFGSEYVFWA